MKRNLAYTFGFLLSIALLTGCTPSKESIIPGDDGTNVLKHKKIEIRNGKTLAYAYFNQNGELINLSKKAISHNKDEKLELVELTDNGFYPKLYFYGEIDCHKKSWTHSYLNKECYSIFTKTNAADAILRNGLIAASTLGFGLLYGGSSSIKTFDYEKFYKTIEDNNLIKKREELLFSLKK